MFPSGPNSAHTVVHHESTALLYASVFLFDLKLKFYSTLNEEVGCEWFLYYFKMKQIRC